MNKELLSECCGYYAQGEIDDDNTGRCSHCKEWTSFEIIKESTDSSELKGYINQ